MDYKFPNIEHINDVLPVIEGRTVSKLKNTVTTRY